MLTSPWYWDPFGVFSDRREPDPDPELDHEPDPDPEPTTPQEESQ